jgi:hypothetical protein
VNKIISYALFKGPDPLAEIFYLRGFYFNCLMNTLVYPEWITVVHVDRYTFDKYQDLFTHLIANYSIKVSISDVEYEHCQKMLWRMEPIFDNDVDQVICRDADALTSMREAIAVNDWLTSGLILHGINDNPAHSLPLLGGMCGFRAEPIRELYGTWENMISKAIRPIDTHGTDQHFLNHVIYEKFRDSYKRHGTLMEYMDRGQIELGGKLGQKTHGSDLCTSFIGAAGCNEMETLRFFRSNLPNWGSDQELWKAYPKLFYWL